MRKAFTVAVLLAGCALTPSAPAQPVGARTSPLAVVLPVSAGKGGVSVPTAGFWVTPSGFWVPTPADVRRLEAALRAHPPAPIGDYHRQYLGIVQGGRRLICINAFDVAPPADWKSRLAYTDIDDGGDGFFHALYDPKTRRFSDARSNGLG